MNGSVAFGAAKQYTEERIGGTPSIFLGYIQEGGSFPTVRQDGSELLLGDFVRGHPNSEFPFIIAGIKINNNKDKVVFEGNNKWQIEQYIYQTTKETPLVNKRTESVSGNKTNQKEVNEEIKDSIADIKGHYIDGRNLSRDVKKVIVDDTVDGGEFNQGGNLNGN